MRSAVLTLALAACSSATTALTRPADLQAAFQQTVPLCEGFFLPNSMARPPGFDINKHKRELEKQIEDRSALFWSHEGSTFLTNESAKAEDTIESGCAEKLLSAFPG